MALLDVQNKEIVVGAKVARPMSMFTRGAGLYIKICTVTRIEDGKLYLDDSPRPMKFPDRLAIVQ